MCICCERNRPVFSVRTLRTTSMSWRKKPVSMRHYGGPDECGVTKAGELVPYLQEGLERLTADPDHYRQFNPENGWGTYETLVRFVEGYLWACQENPDADIEVSR